MSNLLNTYKPLDISFTHGQGIWLWDKNNNKYLDALCGIAVTGIGHNHPVLTSAIKNQVDKVLHISNVFTIPEQHQLAKLLADYTGLSASFFCNSGAEAVEGLIKLARLYNYKYFQYQDPKIIVFEGGFHGRTMGAVSAASNPSYKEPFKPLLPGFILCEYNNIQALEKLANNTKEITAILVELVQGEGGINVPDNDYLLKLRELCDKNNWLLLVDEVQSGIGRTGALFEYQSNNIIPDAISIAKGMANGIPIGALIVNNKYQDLFTPGSHGTTFGGNPLSCRAAIATLEFIIENKLWENAKLEGEFLLEQFKTKFKKYSRILDIRGKGLMLGLELDKPCRDILPLSVKHKLLFNIAANGNIIRLLPPLIINRQDSIEIVNRLDNILAEYFA